MRITPLDICNHPFPRSFNGYARHEVDAFLEMVSADYEALIRGSESYRERIIRRETQVEKHSSNEAIL